MKALASGRAMHLLMQPQSFFSHTPLIQEGPRLHFYTPVQKEQGVRRFSTNTSVAESTDGASISELKQVAINHCRQGNPREAHSILERLESHNAGMVEIHTSVMDSWIKYQASCHAKLKASISDKASLSIIQSHLKEICDAADCASEVLDMIDEPSSHHFVAVLNSWANACEASQESGYVKIDEIRGIPQRSQHILNQQANPTVECYNQVLKAWAYSSEHLRGTMAEQLFQKIGDPNGESYKQIIRAWCWSKERRCAFTATGHFMRMMRLLDTGRSDVEPSIEDYHVLFRAWTQAE